MNLNLQKGKSILILTLVLFCFSNAFSQNATQVNISGSNTVVNIPNNTATVVDSFITLVSNGNITGFTVSITGSYTSGDVLAYNGSLPSGVTAVAFNTATRSLVFSGTTSSANWQDLMRRVTLRTTSAVCNPESRLVSFVVGIKYYNILNGHFYEFYNTNTSWTSAKAYISGLSYFGREGYMATLTSLSENSFASVLIGQNSWIGCSDNFSQINAAVGYSLYANQAAADGNYFWITGPERGLKISSQNAWGSGGVLPVSGSFNNWSSGEPNDWPGLTTSSPGEEDYGHMYTSSGLWNDFANTQSIGSIIEFGGMPNDVTTSQVVFTRSITINGAPSGKINGGNISVCSGSNSTTLSLSGLVGTVVRWESSLDNFYTAGTTISNTTTSLTVNNISTTTYYRVIVNTTSGCSNLATSSTPIYVNASVPGVIVATNNTICAGAYVNFSLYGNIGSVIKWQISTSSNFSTGVTDINTSSTSLNHQILVVGTYYFRAAVQNSGCGSLVYTPGYSISVIVGTAPVGGTLSSNEHCGGSNSGTLNLSGHAGTVQKWQLSLDNGIIWTDIVNTTTSLSYSAVTANRIYRVVLVNGSCGTAYSSTGSVTVYGTTVTRWDGGTSNAWQTASNWCGGVADNGIDMVINSSATNSLVLDQSRIVGRINFNNSNKTITLGSNNLTASDVINHNSSNFVLTNGSGLLKINIGNNVAKTFPIGSTSYNPITITNKTGSADYFSIRVFNEVYNNGYTGFTSNLGRVKRTWDIHKTNPNSGGGIDITMNWNIADVWSLIAPTLYHYVNGAWEMQSGATTSTLSSLTYTGYTGTFSPFAVGSGLTPLPVNLLSFEALANLNTNQTEIRWVCNSEFKCLYFDVMRSSDGKSWESLGRVDSEASGRIALYSFMDENPFNRNFYRLKAVEADGSETLLPIREVIFNKHKTEIEVYPNPSVGTVYISSNQEVQAELRDINGRLIQSHRFDQIWQLDNLAKGVYMLSIDDGEYTRHLKLVIE